MKDDKGYNYIKITPPPFSKISECKQMTEDGSSYLGPYTSGYSVKQAVEETLKIYKLPRCNKQFPRDYGKSRPCLNGFMVFAPRLVPVGSASLTLPPILQMQWIF